MSSAKIFVSLVISKKNNKTCKKLHEKILSLKQILKKFFGLTLQILYIHKCVYNI